MGSVDRLFSSFKDEIDIVLQDGNGFINRHELAVVMSNMGEKLSRDEIQVGLQSILHLKVWARCTQFVCYQAMIDEADLDGDGQINYEEFYSMMNSISF